MTATRQDESVYQLIARDPVQVWPDATLRGVAELLDDLMTYGVVSVDAGTPVIAVAKMMLEDEIRHVPVHDDEGLLGIVSIRDVLRALVERIETPA